jgi:histidinol dehydrogenase
MRNVQQVELAKNKGQRTTHNAQRTTLNPQPFPVFNFADRPSWLDRRRMASGIDPTVAETVRGIIAEVRAGGDEALRRLTHRFDGVWIDQFRISESEIRAAYHDVDQAFVDALRSSIEAVRCFHASQLRSERAVETTPGVRAWRVWRPLQRVGLYVPGGRARYPSSVVMLGVAAAVSGCPERVLVSPPAPDGKVPAPTLVAAAEVGMTEIYAVGGAQAIAALAYGSESIQPVDKIFGPGNVYVTAAKLAVFPEVAVDVPAGPSELMILADDSAEAAWIAADMIANAEHAPDSPVVLISLSKTLVDRVAQAVRTQLATLPRYAIAERALAECGAAVYASDIEQAMTLVNDYAPEHLQLVVDDPHRALKMVENAGSVFLGAYSPNAAGDYATGTNHVLPTGGFARAFQALSIESFGRLMQVQELNAGGAARLTPTVENLARTEGFEGHARAMEIRASENDD